jgi:hypothetical protein
MVAAIERSIPPETRTRVAAAAAIPIKLTALRMLSPFSTEKKYGVVKAKIEHITISDASKPVPLALPLDFQFE